MKQFNFSFDNFTYGAILYLLKRLEPYAVKYLIEQQSDFYQQRIKHSFGIDVTKSEYVQDSNYTDNQIKEYILKVINDFQANNELGVQENFKNSGFIGGNKTINLLMNCKIKKYKRIARQIKWSEHPKNIKKLKKLLLFINDIYKKYGPNSLDLILLREDGLQQYLFCNLLFDIIAGHIPVREILNSQEFQESELDLYEKTLIHGLIAIQEGCGKKELKEILDVK